MGFIANFFQKRNAPCEALLTEVNSAIFDIDGFFENKAEYIDEAREKQLFCKWAYLKEKTLPLSIELLAKARAFNQLTSAINMFLLKINSISQMVANHNDVVIEKAYALIGNVEDQKLDHQQILCVVKKAPNQLVIAGGGTGKTTTIVGKIKYLLKSNLCKPEEILVLSFTKASVAKMRAPINKETGEEIDVLTFRQLGKNIITKCEGIKPKITHIALDRFVNKKLKLHIQEPEYFNTLVSYLSDDKVATKSPQELWREILGAENSMVEGLVELFETVIALIKSNDSSIDALENLNLQQGTNTRANSQLIALVAPLLRDYEQQLKSDDEIDFNDMMRDAIKEVNNKKYLHNYKYVIVNEYQDISKTQYLLLKALRNTKAYDLFCVGDDWRSIDRHAGSDINFILNFARYWDPTELSKIETTYRFSQKLIEISESFIMQNPKQIKKAMHGATTDTRSVLGEVCGYKEEYAVKFMAKKLFNFPQNSTVFFIGRYSSDGNILKDSGFFNCQFNKAMGVVDVVFDKRRDLKMEFFPAHKVKGRQADFVIIINNKNSRKGFPSKIQAAPILNLLLDNYDNYPFAEERRLFYVALTRAKRKVILLTLEGKESEFALELKTCYKKELEEELEEEAFECPVCGGKLLKKQDPYGEFYGCSNYESKGCAYKWRIKE